MKALVLTGPGQVQVAEVPEVHASQGDLLLQVNMVGLCGTDLNSFRGRNPLVTYPRVLGHEIAATVLAGNREIPEGTRVTVSPYTGCARCASCRRGRENACRNNQTFGVQRDGAITERIAVPPSKIYVSALPSEQLALTEPLTVGFHAVARGRVTSTDTVVVFGCGGIGLGAIAGASFRGARTIAVDLDDNKLKVAELAGAAELINSARVDVRATLSELTDGEGPDVMIEAIGLADTFRMAVEEVAYTGRVVYIGYAKEPVNYETKLFVQKELDIMGSRNALPDDFRQVMEMLEAGRFPVKQAITRVVALDEAPDVLAQWSADPGAFTKILIDMSR
jgi:2-desacetyl-2-hydroxyethyl bacteriochlorophyllide A dehydrogenase